MADDSDFEDSIERMFWEFDNRRKKGGESERDIFKGMLRRIAKDAQKGSYDPKSGITKCKACGRVLNVKRLT